MFGLTTIMFRQNKFGKKTTCGSLTMVPKWFGNFKKALGNCTGQVPKVDWPFFLGCFSSQSVLDKAAKFTSLLISVCFLLPVHKATHFLPVFCIHQLSARVPSSLKPLEIRENVIFFLKSHESPCHS